MVFEFCIFTFFNWDLGVILQFMLLPSNRRVKVSIILFGEDNDDAWWIRWSLMESAIILFSLTMSFLYFSLSSSPWGSWTYSIMNLSSSCSLRRRVTMYLQALKLSTPSCFLSNFVLVVILHGTKQKYDQNSKNELSSKCSLLRRAAWWS